LEENKSVYPRNVPDSPSKKADKGKTNDERRASLLNAGVLGWDLAGGGKREHKRQPEVRWARLPFLKV
jgi:hypothetical protein